MNICNSGKIPVKIAAIVAALSIVFFAGCGTTSNPPDSDSLSTVITSENDSVSDVGSDSESQQSSSVSTSDFSSPESSHFSSSTTAFLTTSSSESSVESSIWISSISSTENSAESSSSAITPPVTSSEQSISSSTVLPPDPPVVVTVPDFPMPYSPGTNVSSGSEGVIDFSNASQGYISAKYTGSGTKLKLRIVSGNSKDDYDLSPNTTEYYPLVFGSGNYTATIHVQNPSTGKYRDSGVSATFSVNLSSSLGPFLYSNAYSVYDKNSACVYKAAELCAGKTKTIDKIAAIFMWVADNVSYDYNLAATVQKGYIPNPERTYNSRTGICFDYASLVCAMMRSQSIPTRLVVGYASPDIYHAWNEVYTEETGWIAPDVMLKNAGFNIVDTTFYSTGGSNKSSAAAFISNPSNYQAVHIY